MENFYDFISHNPSVKRIKINDVLFAEYQCPLSETRYDIWSHQNYFIYVTSGRKKWFTVDAEVLVQQGDCLFVRKGAHSVYQYFDAEFCALVMFIPDSFIRSVLLQNRIALEDSGAERGQQTLFSIKSTELLSSYFHSFLAYLGGAKRPEEKLLELKFSELILLVATEAGDIELSGYLSGVCQTAKPSLRDIMENNFRYPMNLSEYSRLSARSLSTFKREFQKLYNMPPGKWLVHKRLELAKYLLTHTDKSVTETAFDCGFKDLSHFSRLFRERYDVAPTEHARKAARTQRKSPQKNL